MLKSVDRVVRIRTWNQLFDRVRSQVDDRAYTPVHASVYIQVRDTIKHVRDTIKEESYSDT